MPQPHFAQLVGRDAVTYPLSGFYVGSVPFPYRCRESGFVVFEMSISMACGWSQILYHVGGWYQVRKPVLSCSQVLLCEDVVDRASAYTCPSMVHELFTITTSQISGYSLVEQHSCHHSYTLSSYATSSTQLEVHACAVYTCAATGDGLLHPRLIRCLSP